MTMHVAIVNALEVSAESQTLHLAEEIRVVGECVLERAVPLAGLPHEDAPTFFQISASMTPGLSRKSATSISSLRTASTASWLQSGHSDRIFLERPYPLARGPAA